MANQVATLRMEQRFKKSPAGEIPVDWEHRRLGDAAQLINGHGFSPKDWATSGVPIIRIQNLNGSPDYNYYEGLIEEDWIVEPGDLLFSWSGSLGTSFGPFIWEGPRAVLNQHIFCVKSYERVDRGYLYQILRKVTSSIEQRAHGSAGLVHITKRELENFPIPVPPIEEQKKISDILFAVDTAIGKTSAIIEKIRKLKKELTQRLLTNGRLDTKFKKSVIGDIPVGWEVVRLADLLQEPIRNGYSPICPDAPTGRWTLGLGALSEQGFRADKAKPAPLDDPKAADALLQIGDLLVSRSNTRELVGLAAIYDGFPSNCIYPDLMMRVRVSPDKMESRFLELYLLSSRGRKYFQSEARGTSGSMLKINSKIVGRMLVPRPPLEDQRDICARIRAVQEELRSEIHCLEKLLSMKGALMQELLTGRSRTFHMK